ncbi:MAG: hypothetical protein KKA42_17005 [candidate division Zixibacteria bacterium]|nr:hypothetical protein [candidate division Zixibacteria bacterium]
MRLTLTVLAIVLIAGLTGCSDQPADQNGISDEEQNTMTSENQVLYYLGLIRRGATWTPEANDAVMKIQEEHLANIERLAGEGLMVLAGPFYAETGDNDLRGIFLYDVETFEEARELADTDPAVKTGRLKVDIYPWIGAGEVLYDEPVQMTTYIAALFRRGAQWTDETTPSYEELLEQQATAIATKCDSGALVFGGMFGEIDDEGDFAAMLIYRADSLTQVEETVSSASWVANDVLDVEVIMWYGPEGLRWE